MNKDKLDKDRLGKNKKRPEVSGLRLSPLASKERRERYED